MPGEALDCCTSAVNRSNDAHEEDIMKFLKRPLATIAAACLVAAGLIAVTGPPAQASAPTEYIDRTIWLEDPPPPRSPTAGLPAAGPRVIFLAAGKYIWCVSLTALGQHNTCRSLDLKSSGNYNWRCYLTHYNESTYYGNCVLDLHPAGSGTPAGGHYYYLPEGGGPRYWEISGDRHYGWTSSLDPQSF
jgi:hypothetical protein